MFQKKNRGIESLKKRYGLAFISPWVLGVALFMILPIFQTILYSLSETVLQSGGIQIVKFVGFKHYDDLINKNATYMGHLGYSLSSVFTSLPIIVALSMILGIILNQKFRGRMIVRAIFFLPVIISSGAVMHVLSGGSGDAVTMAGSMASEASNATPMEAIDFEGILTRLNLPAELNNLLLGYLSDTFNLIWSCGVQTLLFIAGLQTIPPALYEAGKVEGCTAWESFWYITFPMLGRITLLVLFYTMVELFVEDAPLVTKVLEDIRMHSIYSTTSARLWFYFLAVGAVMGIVMFVYYRFCLRKWNG